MWSTVSPGSISWSLAAQPREQDPEKHVLDSIGDGTGFRKRSCSNKKSPAPPGDTARRECRREQQAIARWLPAAPVSATMTIAAHSAITTTITAPGLCRGCARRERDRGQADNARNLRSDRTHRICENNRENREPANQERAKTRRQGHVADPFNCIAITHLVSTPATCTGNARATRTLRQPLTHPALLGSIRASAKGSDA